MTTNPPTPADTRQQLRDNIAETLGLRRNGPASDGRGWYRNEAERQECLAIADALLAGPLADLAALPARVHQLADSVDISLPDIAALLRALTPDPPTGAAVTTTMPAVQITDSTAEACLAVFESIDLLRDASVTTELRAALADYDSRIGQCDGACHELDWDDCPRCCSGRPAQTCPDCLASY